jgi:dienelactone hydrolase
MLWDHQRALDVLSECEDVDPGRIGVVGHGLGATNAILLAAIDDRVRACVASCGFTLLESDDCPERWADDDGLRLLPKLEKNAKTGKYPFDWDEVLALIAPNPTLLVAALNDDRLSHPESAKVAVERAKKVYKLLGAGKAIELHTHRDGHGLSALGRDLADEWFSRWL